MGDMSRDSAVPVTSRPRLDAAGLAAVRRSRRRPRPTQPDYLHLRALLEGLRAALAGVGEPVADVLDVWCGSRPYDDLFPPNARYVGLDVVGNPYGVADVVSDAFLPFDDESFDLVVCIESFQFVREPRVAAGELARVLRPGGSLIVTVPFAYEYEADAPEARYTEHELRALFVGWSDVRVRENGGRTVAWTTLTASLLAGLQQHLARGRAHPLQMLFPPAYAGLNGAGTLLATIEERFARGRVRLPAGLMLTARRPAG
jgi:SAM-dependent methyltransferase